VTEEDAASDGERQGERQRQAHRGEVGRVGDDRRGSGRAAHRHGQGEVDQERPERHERPALAKGRGDGLRTAAAAREAADELVIGRRDHHDDRDDHSHRGDQAPGLAVERPLRGLDRVGDRRDGVRHHGEGEGDEEVQATQPQAGRC
jgi:hypothetical protein